MSCYDGWCGAGLRQTANMQGALRRTQLMNYTLKSGGLVSNAFGTIAVSYSLLHCLLVNGEPALQFEYSPYNTILQYLLLRTMTRPSQ